MVINGKQLVSGIKSRHGLQPDDAVGVVSSFGKSAVVENDGRTISFIATTDSIDLQSEVVVPGGADLSYFDQNNKVFADHSYGLTDVVGIKRHIQPFMNTTTGKAGWKVRVYMLPGNAIADAAVALAAEDSIGCSIGFQALDYGPPSSDEKKAYAGKGGISPSTIIRKWKWLELSVVAFPCNVDCQSQKATADDRTKSLLDRLVAKGKITRHTAAAMGLEDAIKTNTRLTLRV